MDKRTSPRRGQLLCAALLLAPGLALAQTQTPAPKPAEPKVYPALGQDSDQTQKDKTTCSAYAKQDTGVDPLAGPQSPAQPADQQKLIGYYKSYGACMKGHGYTVKSNE
jgi:hypothetical protein